MIHTHLIIDHYHQRIELHHIPPEPPWTPLMLAMVPIAFAYLAMLIAWEFIRVLTVSTFRWATRRGRWSYHAWRVLEDRWCEEDKWGGR